MIINQISIFVENKPGRLAEILGVLSQNGVDIRALSIADTTDFGILRLIVDDSKKAYSVLKENGYVVSITEVIGVCLTDKPGALKAVMDVLNQNNISVEYVYAFIGGNKGEALVVFKVADNTQAIEVFKKNGIKVIEDKNFNV